MDHRRVDRVGLLSPLEESSAEISRDSGIVSQSASSLSMVSDILSSGTVSQSPSFGAAANVVASPSPSLHEAASASQQGPERHDDDDDLVHTAFTYSSYVKATAGEEVNIRQKQPLASLNKLSFTVFLTPVSEILTKTVNRYKALT